MKYLNFVPATEGEKLFQFILREFVGSTSYDELQNINLLRIGGRASEFCDYFLGVYAFNFLGRCLRKADQIKRELPNDSQHSELVRFFQRSLEIAQNPGDRRLDQLALLTFNAENYSGKKISERTKWQTRKGQDVCICYICGRTILHQPENFEDKISYEHIWPSSFGGNSETSNLLPACQKCNEHKDDMLLWQDSHVHSFILSPSPSEEGWKRIKRAEKIAKHRLKVFDVACLKKISLKDAALEIGPANISTKPIDSLLSCNTDDCVDFFNFDFKEIK